MYTILKKILPDSLKNKLNQFLLSQLQLKRIAIEKTIPKVELSQRHIKNLKVILTREDLLELLPKHGIVAELGVDNGSFSEKILSTTSPQKLHLIDLWGNKRYHDGLIKVVQDKMKTAINNGQVEINRGYSTAVVNDFSAHYFDWIYIDTDHTYQTTATELEKYASKMKPLGIIAGHDFVLGNWPGGIRYGVMEAVYEFCQKENWELIYITMEIKGKASFAIRKIID